MRLLISGASGFIGRSLVRQAADAGHQVHALGRRTVPELAPVLAGAVVKDILAVTAADIPPGTDAVIHLATGSSGDRAQINRTSVEGTLALLDACRAAGVTRFVHVSSLSVYPGIPAADPSRLDGRALEPFPERRGVYAESKTLADIAVQEAVQAGRHGSMEVVLVRPGLVFGTDMAGALAGTAVELPLGIGVITGQGAAAVPLLAMDDLSAGLTALCAQAAEPGRFHSIDILSPPLPTRRRFLASYARMTGRPRFRIALPAFLVMAAAWVLEGLFRLGGRRKDLPHKVRRLYAFDPAMLDSASFWRKTGVRPTGTAETCLRQALTLDRDPAPATGADAAARLRAERLLAVAATPLAGAGRDRRPVILIGAGRIVEEMHLPALAALPVRVVGVVDPIPSLAGSVAARLPGATAFADLDAVPASLLEGATAIVATPGITHPTLGTRLLRAGCDVVLEKPASLDRPGLAMLRAAAADTGRAVSIVQNYRLRPNTLRLWRFLAAHDPGAPVRARVVFHTGRILNEPARWAHREVTHRVLLLELGLHFLDIALQVTGPVTEVRAVDRVLRRDGSAVVSAVGLCATASGATLGFELDATGTATRTRIEIEFERAAVVLDFFPEGFRILPRRGNPVDDGWSAAGRLAGMAWQRLLPRRGGTARRALPHARILADHLRRTAGASATAPSPFALEEIGPTMMESLLLLADAIYPADGTRSKTSTV
ncbi:Gfo/Idh/MocA family oxidoreductase [Rhodospirillum centenum]|uniref:NAD dependent epimerase n=1 Tax=Rhodospirillum centenum (strain ATCC 51521 / SW) TaxID=414684 RepID=B6IYI2_RHOCS|nr:NAD-dependent epimerase/dehydratase family protein [Rhodospirillum centenum]ACJ01356.1 NAD dependent epimerase [Rhodospirillum centenum SW]